MKRPLCILAVLFLLVVTLLLCFATQEETPQEKTVSLQGTLIEKRIGKSYGEPCLQYLVKEENSKKLFLCTIENNQDSCIVSQQIKLQGQQKPFMVATNPGQFDQQSYYRQQGITGQLQKAQVLGKRGKGNLFKEKLWEIGNWSSAQIIRFMGEEKGSVLNAITLGQKSLMDTETKELYQDNGMAHVLAISGLHISLAGMGVYRVLMLLPLPRILITVFCSILMLSYGIMTGMSVSASRAIIMFLVMLWGKQLGRTYDSLSALAFACILQLILEPRAIASAGFQLSYIAVLGVVLVVPTLQSILKINGKLISTILVSVGVTITILPIQLFHFGECPWYGFFINLLILPFLSFLLAGGFFLLLLSVCFPPAGVVLAFCLKLLLGYYQMVGNLGGMLFWKDGPIGRPDWWQIVFYYLCLLVFLRMGFFFGKNSVFLWLPVMVLLLTLHFPGALRIVMLDVGQGDGFVIENTNGNVYLMDGGSSSVKEVGKYRLLPFLTRQGYHHIKAIFLSHGDLDHYSGIVELLQECRKKGIVIERIVFPSVLQGDETIREICELASSQRISVAWVKKGSVIKDGKLNLTCLYPNSNKKSDTSYPTDASGNNASMVLRLQYKQFSMLFTGDLEAEGETVVMETTDNHFVGQPVTVLKVAHHGSKNSTSEEWIKKWQPRIAMISAGEHNSYGHPHKETLERLQEMGCEIESTIESGAVTLRTNGKYVKVFRVSQKEK